MKSKNKKKDKNYKNKSKRNNTREKKESKNKKKDKSYKNSKKKKRAWESDGWASGIVMNDWRPQSNSHMWERLVVQISHFCLTLQ